MAPRSARAPGRAPVAPTQPEWLKQAAPPQVDSPAARPRSAQPPAAEGRLRRPPPPGPVQDPLRAPKKATPPPPAAPKASSAKTAPEQQRRERAKERMRAQMAAQGITPRPEPAAEVPSGEPRPAARPTPTRLEQPRPSAGAAWPTPSSPRTRWSPGAAHPPNPLRSPLSRGLHDQARLISPVGQQGQGFSGRDVQFVRPGLALEAQQRDTVGRVRDPVQDTPRPASSPAVPAAPPAPRRAAAKPSSSFREATIPIGWRAPQEVREQSFRVIAHEIRAREPGSTPLRRPPSPEAPLRPRAAPPAPSPPRSRAKTPAAPPQQRGGEPRARTEPDPTRPSKAPPAPPKGQAARPSIGGRVPDAPTSPEAPVQTPSPAAPPGSSRRPPQDFPQPSPPRHRAPPAPSAPRERSTASLLAPPPPRRDLADAFMERVDWTGSPASTPRAPSLSQPTVARLARRVAAPEGGRGFLSSGLDWDAPAGVAPSRTRSAPYLLDQGAGIPRTPFPGLLGPNQQDHVHHRAPSSDPAPAHPPSSPTPTTPGATRTPTRTPAAQPPSRSPSKKPTAPTARTERPRESPAPPAPATPERRAPPKAPPAAPPERTPASKAPPPARADPRTRPPTPSSERRAPGQSPTSPRPPEPTPPARASQDPLPTPPSLPAESGPAPATPRGERRRAPAPPQGLRAPSPTRPAALQPPSAEPQAPRALPPEAQPPAPRRLIAPPTLRQLREQARTLAAPSLRRSFSARLDWQSAGLPSPARFSGGDAIRAPALALNRVDHLTQPSLPTPRGEGPATGSPATPVQLRRDSSGSKPAPQPPRPARTPPAPTAPPDPRRPKSAPPPARTEAPTAQPPAPPKRPEDRPQPGSTPQVPAGPPRKASSQPAAPTRSPRARSAPSTSSTRASRSPPPPAGLRESFTDRVDWTRGLPTRATETGEGRDGGLIGPVGRSLMAQVAQTLSTGRGPRGERVAAPTLATLRQTFTRAIDWSRAGEPLRAPVMPPDSTFVRRARAPTAESGVPSPEPGAPPTAQPGPAPAARERSPTPGSAPSTRAPSRPPQASSRSRSSGSRPALQLRPDSGARRGRESGGAAPSLRGSWGDRIRWELGGASLPAPLARLEQTYVKGRPDQHGPGRTEAPQPRLARGSSRIAPSSSSSGRLPQRAPVPFNSPDFIRQPTAAPEAAEQRQQAISGASPLRAQRGQPSAPGQVLRAPTFRDPVTGALQGDTEWLRQRPLPTSSQPAADAPSTRRKRASRRSRLVSQRPGAPQPTRFSAGRTDSAADEQYPWDSPAEAPGVQGAGHVPGRTAWTPPSRARRQDPPRSREERTSPPSAPTSAQQLAALLDAIESGSPAAQRLLREVQREVDRLRALDRMRKY